MKITQVETGILPIPPNGWGAVEKIIWEYAQRLRNLGDDVHIRYLNNVDRDSDIVHCHIANLAVEAGQKGIPYIFSLHDHHVVHYGKGSGSYMQNLEAIKGSVISFCHAEYLVDYFDETDKLFYIPHGVNTDYFTPPKDIIRKEHKLLCLANNGIGGDSSYDRKGFRYAIEAAKKLNLPITITGSDNNLKFFEANKDLLNYDKLNLILYNPKEDEILDIYRSHSIFLHPSILEAGHPNLTILEAISCGLPVVGTYQGSKNIKSLYKVELDSNSVANGIKQVIDNYEEYVKNTKEDKLDFDWDIIVKRLHDAYSSVKAIKKNYTSDETKRLYVNTFENTEKSNVETEPDYQFIFHSVDGVYFEIKSKINTDKIFKVEFIDNNGSVLYSDTVSTNMWVKLNRKYHFDLTCRVTKDDSIIYNSKLNLAGKRVYICLDSKSLGDTLAWMPYAREFRQKHNCEVILSTFWNNLFKNKYPDIQFVNSGSVVHNLTAMYKIGWFYDHAQEPEPPSTIPLQKAATNILGLDFKEIVPDLDFTPKEPPYAQKYVTIATHSTAGLKYWGQDKWQRVTETLKSMGFLVVSVSKEGCDISGIEYPDDLSIENTMNLIHHSEFFIGLSSGLSWLAWALKKQVFMIANFSEKTHEFQQNCTRFVNESVCHACWNNPMFRFDKGDWNWCPEHKGTDRQFECQNSITPDMVLNAIDSYVSNQNNNK